MSNGSELTMLDDPLERERPLTIAQRLLAGLHLDGPLLAGLMVLCGLGLVVLYSASGQSESLLIKQLVRLGVAAVAMLFIAQIPPKMLKIWTPWIFALGILLLVMVLVAGEMGKGAQRWLDIGFVRFQPSEIMKLAVPMMAAWYLMDRPLPPRLSELAILLVICLLPAALIAQQPDLVPPDERANQADEGN